MDIQTLDKSITGSVSTEVANIVATPAIRVFDSILAAMESLENPKLTLESVNASFGRD